MSNITLIFSFPRPYITKILRIYSLVTLPVLRGVFSRDSGSSEMDTNGAGRVIRNSVQTGILSMPS